MFERSVAGQSNRALFYGVDLVVYGEGGRDEKGVTEAFDGLFWRGLFKIYQPALKIKFIPRGGKDNLLPLIPKIVNGSVENVAVAMDRDYDFMLGREILHHRVLYTYGYSYENDIFSRNSLVQAAEAVCPICDKPELLAVEIDSLIDTFLRESWWPSLADFYGRIANRKVLDRDKIQRYFNLGAYGAKPSLNKAILLRDVKLANSGIPRAKIKNRSFQRHMIPHMTVGHFYAAFCFKIIVYLQKSFSSLQKLTKDALRTISIQSFHQMLMTDPNGDYAKYYREIISAS